MDRKVAEQFITSYGGPDGSFLIRESTKFPGDYSLSFLYVSINVVM